jgi:ComF family protein
MGVAFCEGCQAQVELILPPICRRCGCALPEEGLCSRCRALASCLDEIVAVAVFADPLRPAIHALKYENNTTLARPLGALMVNAWQRGGMARTDLIVPVPLHSRRQAKRGYNQSVLLARVLGRGVGIPVDEHTLIRLRATPPQVGLGLAERQQNVEGAFACRGVPRSLRGSPLQGKAVVVVDDVCTTGATLEACAAALRANGATSVWAFTLARARWDLTHSDAAPDAAPAE